MPGRSSGLRMTADDDSVHVRMGYKETSHKKFLDLISTELKLKELL